MKRLFAILLVAILATSFAMAAHNDPVTANAQFDVKVITPIVVTEEGDITLPTIIKGQIRTWSPMVMTFAISGEKEYAIDVTTDGPTAAVGNPTGALVLLPTTGAWSAVPTVLDELGNAAVTWSCTGADAGLASTGTYNFTLKVEAKYTGL